MKKTFKRALSILLSALMVVSMLPVFSITAAADEWIAVASNNLSDSHWSWVNRFDDNASAWGWAMQAFTNNDDQNDLDWMSVQYYDWGDLDNGNMGNGYLYLDGSTTPITGLDTFKIDIQFKFTDSFDITNNGGTNSGGADFLILTTNDGCDWFSGDARANYVFKQSGYGNLSFNSGASSDDSKTAAEYRIATNNPGINVNSVYHYVVTYANGTLNAYIADASGSKVVDYGSHSVSINTSDIKNIVIGMTNGTDASYNYQKINYSNINFYRGVTADDFNASSLATPSFGFAPKHIDSAINTNSYSNVVYASGTAWDGNGSANNSYIGIGRMDFKIATPYETVMVYDGENEVSYPVVLEQHRNQSSGDSQLIHYMGSYDGDFGLVRDWAGGSTDYSQWPSGDDTFAYYDENNYNESNNLNNDNHHFYGNKMVYKNSGDTDKYYTVVENQKYYGKTSYKETTASRQNKYGDVTSYSKQYVINYQPIYSILSDAGSLATEITTNAWKYTPASVSEAKKALYLVGACNPNNYSYSSGVETAVKKCAADIKQARDAYDAISLVKNTFTATFKAASGSTIEERSITAGDALGTLPANTAGATRVPGTNTHTVYTWDGVAAEDVITADAEYTEVPSTVSCVFTDVHTAATDASNGYTTYTCTCGNSYVEYDALDFTEYTAAVADYNTTTGAADYAATYTEVSRTAYEAAVEAAKLTATQEADETLAPKAIADATAAITGAKSLLEVNAPDNSYNLTLEDDIDVNFNIDTEYYEAEGGTIKYSYITTSDAEIEAERTETTVAVSSLPTNTDGTKQITMDAAPAQIAEPYIIEIYDAQGTLKDTLETSIVDYCDAIIAAPLSDKITANDKEVARGLLDYGAAADAYFGYAATTSTAGYTVHNSDDYDTFSANFDAESFKGKAKAVFTPGVDASGADVNITGVSYVALLEPEFRFYVSQTNEVYAAMTDVSIDLDGLEAKMIKTSNGNCVRVTGLKASDFGKNFTITIGTAKLTYNGYAFLYTVLREGSTIDSGMKNLAKGTYRYAAACEAEFA